MLYDVLCNDLQGEGAILYPYISTFLSVPVSQNL
jgi:hypothetical protein